MLEHYIGKDGYTLKNRRTMDELNILTFAEPGAREKLYELIEGKERGLTG